MSTIGTRVRELRQSKGLTQQALAGDGISAGYVSLIESGKRVPSEDVVRRLADRLGVDFETLNRDEELAPVTDQALLEMNFARMALANGNPAEAVRCLNGLMLRGLDSSTACDVALVLAEALAQTGQLDEAVKTLESLVARCRREESWLVLGTAAASLGDDVRRVLRQRPRRARRPRRRWPRSWQPVSRAPTSTSGSGPSTSGPATSAATCSTPRTAPRSSSPSPTGSGSTRARGSIYWNASMVAHGRGRIEDALRLTERALALMGEQTASRDLPRLRLHYAWLLLNVESPSPRDAIAAARPRRVRPGPPRLPDGPRAGRHPARSGPPDPGRARRRRRARR